MSLRVLLMLGFLVGCRDPSTLVGTALLVSVDSSEVPVDQLRFEAHVDGGALFEPTSRPETPAGVLAPTTLVRVLLNDALDGRTAEVKVAGLSNDTEAGAASGKAVIKRGFEVLVALKLQAPMSCAGCVDAQAGCVTSPSVTACGVGGSACVACDSRLADSCSGAGACTCGNEPSCSLALGADRCANGQCRCGTGPACSAGQECLAQTCQCTPSSCAGCCVGSVCVTTPSSSSCGTGGKACLDCGATACTGGQCASSACNPTSCPSGCCAGASCVTTQANESCGHGGTACVSCGVGQCDADAGVCVGGCGPSNCPSGCCQGGVCQPGTSPAACGTGGQMCSSCAGACTRQACAAPCGPATCPMGCCQAGVCRSGRSDTVCGTGAAACVSCAAGSSCDAMGRCVPTAVCGASSCAQGCCDGDTCQTPSASACGTLGRACKACQLPLSDGCNLTTGECACGAFPACAVGQRCNQGRCECDATSCAGCCRATICEPGTVKQACGMGGAACQNCTGGRQCVNRACTP